MSSFGPKTTAEEVATFFHDEIQGKNVLITGVSPNGLGAEVVRVLAKHANLVIIASRSQERMDKSIAVIKKETPAANIRTLVVDLSSLASVRAAAKEVNAYPEPIHVLFNNAASVDKGYSRTIDGFESQFGANHIGPFLFTNLILSRLRAAASPSFAPRIVNVSSIGHQFSDINYDSDGDWKHGVQYDGFVAYGQTKTANILFAIELTKRLAKDGILAFSLHPGGIMTNIMASLSREELKRLQLVDAEGNDINRDTLKTFGEGSSTHLVAAFDPSLKDHSGAYLVDCQVHNEQRAPFAADPENAARLWALSEKLIGEKFL